MEASQSPRDSKLPDPLVLQVAAVSFTLAKLLLNQLTFLADHGFTVRVAAAAEEAGFPQTLAEFEPVDVRIPRSLRPVQLLRGVHDLRRLTWQLRPTILHVHTPAAGIPVRMIPRMLFPPGMLIAFTVHGYKHKWTSDPLDRLLQGLERVLSPRADITFFQSREDLETALARGYRGNLKYLGNGVDDEWFDLRPAKRNGPLRLIYVGRLVREKGLRELIDAVSAVADVRLVIAGGELPSDRDGITDELNQRLRNSEVGQRVTLTGMLERSELMQAMGEADVIILPSFREGVPQALMQGMASGRPAIATDIRGCRELVSHGENGILVPAEDAVALAAAIRQVRDLPEAKFDEWSRSARASMAETRRIDQVLDRLLAAYVEVLPA